MILRCKFSKLYPINYISHLELMETLRRAFRRAEIPAAFSKGYNPHFLFSLGSALALGIRGKGEYFDLEIDGEIKENTFIKRVNRKLPAGLKILTATAIPAKSKSLMAVINTAIYLIEINFKENSQLKLIDIREEFLLKNRIEVVRERRKKPNKIINIRPLIYDFEIKNNNLVQFTVATGSTANLRAEEIIKGLRNIFNEIGEIPLTKVIREGLYIRLEGELYSPTAKEVIGR